MVDRYGAAIEYDLQHELGLDLIDFFRRRYSWRKLLTLIERLPRNSRYAEARLDDDEWAQEAIKEQASKSAPPWSGFTPEVEMLTLIVELMQGTNARLDALGDRKPGAVREMPRPETALDRAREARRVNTLLSLISEAEAAIAAAT